MPNISGLATNATLTAVENKIPYISSLVKKNKKLLKLKRNLLILTMIYILQLQSLML